MLFIISYGYVGIIYAGRGMPGFDENENHAVAPPRQSHWRYESGSRGEGREAFSSHLWAWFEEGMQLLLALDVAVKLVTGYHVLGAAVSVCEALLINLRPY